MIAFTQQEGMQCLQVIDERSAAFFALGMAQQLHAPVALICTSGSAVLNYGPAIAEAFYQRIPLLVITADRPEEWVDQGEGQAIRQQGVLVLHMKKSVQLPRLASDDLARWHGGRLINEAIDATLLPVPGPVHVNVPFAEPLYGLDLQASSLGAQASSLSHANNEQAGRLFDPKPIAQVMTESFILPEHARWLISNLNRNRKVMVLGGQGQWSDALKQQLKQLASLPQVTVMVEATSNLDDESFITCIDRAIEGVHSTNENDLKPDLLITFGGAVVSKRIKGLLRKWKPEQHWNIDAGQRHYDTYQSLTHDIAVSPEVFFAQLVQPLTALPKATETSSLGDDYAMAWKTVNDRTRDRHAAILNDTPWCDLKASEIILQHIPDGSDVHLANSTPARYAQLFDRRNGLRWFSNRGTSGIDGCTSTAVGSAFASQRPTTLITGDTAFLYDSNAFWNAHLSPLLRVIVIDNGGGNIFRYIEGPDQTPELLKWFEAPHGRDPLALVKSFELPWREAKDGDALREGLEWLYGEQEKSAVLVVRTDAELSPKVLREYFKKLRA